MAIHSTSILCIDLYVYRYAYLRDDAFICIFRREQATSWCEYNIYNKSLSEHWHFTFLLRNMYRRECSPERRFWVDWLRRWSQPICAFLSYKILELK